MEASTRLKRGRIQCRGSCNIQVSLSLFPTTTPLKSYPRSAIGLTPTQFLTSSPALRFTQASQTNSSPATSHHSTTQHNMSRGGRGGGRGGRGGRGGKNPYPWEEDKNLKVSYAPLEAYPVSSPAPPRSPSYLCATAQLTTATLNPQHYNVPVPSAVTEREKAQVRSFLLFREQVHDGPLYTATRSFNAFAASGSSTPRAYGQEQINQRYGKKDKGTIDPFTAMEMPSSRMKRVERALPDLGARPFSMCTLRFQFPRCCPFGGIQMCLNSGLTGLCCAQQRRTSFPRSSTPPSTMKTSPAKHPREATRKRP